jgi:hypothetical protein
MISTQFDASGEKFSRDFRGRGNWPQHGYASLAEDVLHHYFFQARGVVVEVEVVLFFVKAEPLQAVGIRKTAEGAVLLGGERLLELVGHGHEGHGGDYTIQ